MSDETGTEIVTFAPDNPVAIFQTPDQVDKLIAHIEEVVKAHKPDTSTKKGRAEIASLARKVVTTKTTLDAAGKGLNEERRKLIDAVDEQRRSIRTRLDDLRDLARKPLDEWEAAETARIEVVRVTMDLIDGSTNFPDTYTSAEIQARIDGLTATEFDADIFQDMLPLAISAKSKAIESLAGHLSRAVQAEADAAELEKLRAAQAERDEQDRQRQAAEAEQEQERLREARRQQEIADAEVRRLADIAEAERAATEAATQKAAQEAQAAIDAAQAEAKRLQDAEDARTAEENRIAEEQRARESDRAHRSAVMKAAKEAIMAHSGATEEVAKKIVLAIVAGEVPAVSLAF